MSFLPRFALFLLLATPACAATTESLEASEGALAAPEVLRAGVERERAGSGAGSTAAVQQRSVHFGNAHTLAILSKAAYAKTSTPESLAALGVPGVTRVTAFDDTCTGGNAIYVTFPSASVLAFRGTETDSQLDLDINEDDAFHAFPLARGGERAEVHNGFRRQFESLWNGDAACGVRKGIGAFLAEQGANRPLYLTGHSLGGALASLALAQTFVEGIDAIAPAIPTPKIEVAALYTFGAPKVGNGIFAEVVGDHAQVTQTPIFRFVHGNDLVATLPRPFGTLFREEWNHMKPSGEGEHALQVWFDEETAKIGTRAAFVGISIPDHAIDGYVKGIAGHARRRNELP